MHNRIAALSAPDRAERILALRGLRRRLDEGTISHPRAGEDVNNHIHTTYSFSPYSPAEAVWMAYTAGLSTAGIVDHDSISGADEFIEAGRVLDFPVTCGFELRCTHTGTPLGQRRTNNPDQCGVSYITFHGIPHTQFGAVKEFLRPVCEARGERNRAMLERINGVFKDAALDYERDVLPLSMRHDGGSVTERHLLYALALKLISVYGKGPALIQALEAVAPVDAGMRGKLADPDNIYHEYDLLGWLKAYVVIRFYIPADSRECPDIQDAMSFANRHGIIMTYPYLGDVTQSVTGDKKAQTFEDGFLDELFEIIDGLGFRAVSYMPSRNTMEQIARLRALCGRYQMMQISGEDINTPRQSFVCTAMRDPAFANLYDTTWALIGHEQAASEDLACGFMNIDLPLEKKIEHFKSLAYVCKK